MNWIHFLLWLAGIYFLYYLTVILLDTAKHQNPQTAGANGHELTFFEQHSPHDAALLLQESEAQFAHDLGTPNMIASGGVLLKDVFSLARKEAIVYLKEVSFN
ncbi:MAG: hypothetical protein ACXVJB_00075 [Mucilaginibacter sp.]